MTIQEIDYFGGANPILHYVVHPKDGRERSLILEIKYCIHGGNMAKDKAAVASGNYIKAMRAYGLKFEEMKYPPSGSVAFLVPTFNATVSNKIYMFDNATTAAIEPTFLVDDKGTIYVTAGSDHCDWEFTKGAGPGKSRIYAPRPMSRDVWLYEDVKDHWNQINMKLYGYPQSKRELYEDFVLGRNLDSETILNIAREQTGIKDFRNLAYISGGGGSVMPELMRSKSWDMEMIDPVLNRTIKHHYDVEVMWHRVPYKTKEPVPEWYS